MNCRIVQLIILSIVLWNCDPVRIEKNENTPQTESVEIDESYQTAIDDLANLEVIQKAFDHIDQSESLTMETLITLTEIAAPPFKETNRGNKYFDMLQEAGVDSVWTDQVGNVIGLRKGHEGKKVMALAAHLDTVFPEGTPVTVKQRGDTLYAPGVADDTRGLSTLLTILRSMNAAGIRTRDDLLFIGNVGEEGIGDLRGSKHLFREDGPRIDYFISVDGTDSESVINRGLGSHRYRVTFKGPGGHSWGAFGLANPHHALGAAIKYFVDEADRYTASGIKTSYNVGRIGGGTSVNSIPFSSWMEVDMRSESPQRLAEIDSIFQNAMRKGLEEQNNLLRNGRKLSLLVEMIGNRPSGETTPDEALVQRALAATRHFNEDPQLRISSTDSNIPISKGIPAITLGGGGIGKGAHSLGEYYVNQNGARGIKRVLLVVAAQAGVISPRK